MHIGDLARRLGMRVDTLRAWERRYGLLQPQRSTGGFRLYSRADEAIVRAMIVEIDRGFPPAQAAKLALAGRPPRAAALPAAMQAADHAPAEPAVSGTNLEVATAELYRTLMYFGGVRAHEMLDVLLAELTLNTVLRDVVMPCLRLIGDAWERGDINVAQEHFSSQVIRDRLLGLAREWDQGLGPRVVLACPTDEQHDIALICFGLVLSRSGWRVTFLGPDTPMEALAHAAETLSPDLMVLTANEEGSFVAIAAGLRALAAGHQLAIAGRGATPAVARAAGATVLAGGPVEAAVQVAAGGREWRGTGKPV
ncbi:MAG: MerR family transcriptional regulator [Mycobacteriales bacterium]